MINASRARNSCSQMAEQIYERCPRQLITWLGTSQSADRVLSDAVAREPLEFDRSERHDFTFRLRREISGASSQDCSISIDGTGNRKASSDSFGIRPCPRRLRSSWRDFTEQDRARSPLHERESLSMCPSSWTVVAARAIGYQRHAPFYFLSRTSRNSKRKRKSGLVVSFSHLWDCEHRLTMFVLRQRLVRRLSRWNASVQKIATISLEKHPFLTRPW